MTISTPPADARGSQTPPADAGGSLKPIRYLLVAMAFAAAYGQAPLYYSNQNQYFLHGFALADRGLLREDWLANTLDPTPIFSQLTAWTIEYSHPWFFHLYLAVLMGIYAVSMLSVGQASSLPFPQPANVGQASSLPFSQSLLLRRWLLFAFLFVLMHSAALRWLSYRLGPVAYRLDYPWYFQAGVASQYLLGAMFQPSVFGVFLAAGLCFFLHDRLVLSSLCIAGAATMHNTYLLPGAMLTAGFLVQLAVEKRYRAGLLIGLLTLGLVLPTVVHSLQTFGPTTAEQFARSQDILANDRIPHHCRVDRWLDAIAVVQIAWMLLGLVLVWKTRLFAVFAVCLALSTVLTVVQAATQSNLLALLFPWRISALLVPLATTIIVARLAVVRMPLWLPATGLLTLAAVGIGISVGRQAFQGAVEDVPLMDFVHAHKQPGDIYLLPVKAPKRGNPPTGWVRSISSDFRPPPDKKQDNRLIPLDLQQFRLHAEAPIFVDFKAIPYKDVEVLQWYDRLLFAEDVQEKLKKGEIRQVLSLLRDKQVTHVVQPADDKELLDPALQLVNQDPRYRLYKIIP